MGFSENRLNLTSDRILLFSFSLSLSPFKNQKMKKKSPPLCFVSLEKGVKLIVC